jgi:hypothetical protein
MLKATKGQLQDEVHYSMFSFYLGYISHVFADGIIHPFVRDKVGEYAENQSEHRSLEMQLDVLLLEELTENSGFISELNYTNLHDELENFSNLEGVNKIVESFSDLIKTTYNEHHSVEKILSWIKGLHRMFGIAEGDYPKVYRNLKANSFTYRNRSDINREKAIILTKPKDIDINFLKIEKINFFTDCVPQYYSRFTEVAQKAYSYVYEEGQELNDKDIPLINLDTGRLVDANKLNLIPEFWKKN